MVRVLACESPPLTTPGNRLAPTQFESSSPSQTHPAERQRVQIASFLPSPALSSPLLANLSFTEPTPPVHRLLLDEDEQFGGVMLSLSVRGLDRARCQTKQFGAKATRGYAPVSFATGIRQPSRRVPLDGGGQHSALPERPDTPPATPPITWSITLADGFDRLYRSWFEDLTLTTFPQLTAPYNTQHHTLHALTPSPCSSLRSVQIRCAQQAPSECGRDLYGKPRGQAAVFEYEYEGLVVDVGKVLVGMEEAVERGCGREAVVVLQWVRL